MNFIRKVVAADEKLISIAYVHWIYGLKGLLWMTGFVVLGVMVNGWYSGNGQSWLDMIGTATLFCSAFVGLIIFAYYLIFMLVTEVGITSKRLIFKTGWIAVDVHEVDIEEIKGLYIDNGLVGRFLGYAYLKIDARFLTDVEIPAISKPYLFSKTLNVMRSKLAGDTVEPILDSEERPKKTKKEKAGKKETKQPSKADFKVFKGNPVAAAKSVLQARPSSKERGHKSELSKEDVKEDFSYMAHK